MISIARVFVGEFMSSPQNRRSYRNGGSWQFNADIFLDIEELLCIFVGGRSMVIMPL